MSNIAKMRHSQAGIGLPAAIFVITVLVLIAYAIAEMVAQNAASFEEEVNLTRAFYAAESGAGFAMNNIYPPEDFPSYSYASACPASRTYNFTVSGLNQCSATVTCSLLDEVSGTDYATIESVGSCGDVSRTIQVRTGYQD